MYDLVFEVSVSGPENYLLFVTFTNPYPIISIGEIQLSKSFYLAKSIQQFTNQRQRILVFNSNIVKTLIIHTKTKAFIWLFVKQNENSSRGLGKPDKANGQISFDISLQGLQLYQFRAIDRLKRQLLTFFYFDGMLIHSGIFWKFCYIFYSENVVIVGIFCRNLSKNLIKQQSPNLGLLFRMHQYFFLLPDGHIYHEYLVINI